LCFPYIFGIIEHKRIEKTMRRKIITKEEKLAKIILDKLADITLDLEMVGYYIAYNVRGVLYNRFTIISETAEEERERLNDRKY
jgi:hypothetical protein